MNVQLTQNPIEKIVVTRHKALVEYLVKEGLVSKDVVVIDHATEDAIRDKHVFGVLPHSLSHLTVAYTEVALRLPPELRGQELTLEDMYKYAQGVHTYRVDRVD